MKSIYELINNPELDNKSKQFAIESLCLEYDLNWWENEFKFSIDARSVMLHDIHKKLDHAFFYILQPFIKNNFSLLHLLYLDVISDHSDCNKKECKFKCLLAIFILGNNRIIGTSFKLLIEVITNSDDHMQINKTEFIFKLGDRLFK